MPDPAFSLNHPSTGMKDWIEGTFILDGLDREERVILLNAVITTYKAVLDCGMLEHTGDWDWRIEVVWGDAELVSGTYDLADSGYVWSDTISLNYTVEPGDYTDHFARWNYLSLIEFRETTHDDPEVDVLVPIDQIRRITIGRA